MSEIPHRRPCIIHLEARDKQRDSSNKSLKRLNLSPEITLKSRHCLNFLNSRALGKTAGEQAKKEFYQIKTSHKEKVSYSNLRIPFSYDSCEVIFIKGDDKSLFGVWCLRNGKEKFYVEGEISYNMNNEDVTLVYEQSIEAAVDMCRCHAGLITLYSCYIKFPTNSEMSNLHLKVDNNFLPPWYCCCFFPFRQPAYVLGGDGYFIMLTFNRTRAYRLNLPGKVCTVSYYEPSNTFVLGLDIGVLWILHYGPNYKTFYLKLSDKAINDFVFVNDHEMIVTDIEGKLLKVDLRTQKTTAEFFGHKHSVTKRPLSVANDLLCATGADNAVRIWHLSGGHPVHVQKPTSTHEVRGWLNSDGVNTYLNYFERDTRTVFKI